MAITCLYPIYVKSRGPAYACQSILEAMRMAGADVRLFCITAEKGMQQPYHRYVMPLWGKRLWFRIFSSDNLRWHTEWRFRSSFHEGDLAYAWPGTTLETFQFLKSKGQKSITENINTHQATSKEILDTEYRRLGLMPNHGITDAAAAEEDAKLNLVDFVFSPSEEVTKSLLKAGVLNNKIIGTSYGLDASDMLPVEDIAARVQNREICAIFVGRVGIRKGVHLLLEYWARAGVKGKLKLVGNIEPDAKQLVTPYLDRPDIEHIPFTMDLKSLYREADVFIFPSLEEGSPLVTYLSLGAGLPSLVSPMGAGGIIRDRIDGLIIDPHDAEGWVKGIQNLFGDAQMRERFGNSAYQQAQKYLWPVVGRQRLEALRTRMAENNQERL